MNTWQIRHPNAKGTGSMLSLSLHPAQSCGRGGFIRATITPQTQPTPFASFSERNGITIDLGWERITEIVRVLRGEIESIGDGKGSYRRFDGGAGTTNADLVKFDHSFDDVRSGYDLGFYYAEGVKDNTTTGWKYVHIILTPSEALSLSMALEGAFTAVVFGLPDFRVEMNG